MASAKRTPYGWTLDFRPLHAPGKQRRSVRVTAAELGAGADLAKAVALAKECDRYCRLCEARPVNPLHVEHALQIRAITEQQADELRTGIAPSDTRADPLRPWTVAEAAAAHPSSQREARVYPDLYRLYLKHLEDFCQFAKVRSLAEVELEHALRWVEHMRAAGISWGGRRHRLLYLRRACRMGSTKALPDVLSGLLMDRNEDEDWEVQYWTLEQLGQAIRGAVDPRVRAAVALGGFIGLRPSETARCLVGDLAANDVLNIGVRERKNRASRRSLPIPPAVALWWRECADGRKPEEPLLAPRSPGARRTMFDNTVFGQWLNPILAELTGRKLPVKCLRKSFATWAVSSGMSGRHVEAYLGHQTALVSLVTSRHYLGEVLAGELRPAAAQIQTAIETTLTGWKVGRETRTKLQVAS